MKTSILAVLIAGLFSSFSAFSMAIAPIPEPETYAMLLAGLGVLGIIAKRNKK